MKTSYIRFKDLAHLSNLINSESVKSVISIDYQNKICLYETNDPLEVTITLRAKHNWTKLVHCISAATYLFRLREKRAKQYASEFHQWCADKSPVGFEDNELYIDKSYIIDPHAMEARFYHVNIDGHDLIESRFPNVGIWCGGKIHNKPDYDVLGNFKKIYDIKSKIRMDRFQHFCGKFNGIYKKVWIPYMIRSSYGVLKNELLATSNVMQQNRVMGLKMDKFIFNGKEIIVQYQEEHIPLSEQERMKFLNDSEVYCSSRAWLSSFTSTRDCTTLKVKPCRYKYGEFDDGKIRFPSLNVVDDMFKLGIELGYIMKDSKGYFHKSTKKYVDEPVINGETYISYMERRNSEYITYQEHIKKLDHCKKILDKFVQKISNVIDQPEYCYDINTGKWIMPSKIRNINDTDIQRLPAVKNGNYKVLPSDVNSVYSLFINGKATLWPMNDDHVPFIWGGDDAVNLLKDVRLVFPNSICRATKLMSGDDIARAYISRDNIIRDETGSHTPKKIYVINFIMNMIKNWLHSNNSEIKLAFMNKYSFNIEWKPPYVRAFYTSVCSMYSYLTDAPRFVSEINAFESDIKKLERFFNEIPDEIIKTCTEHIVKQTNRVDKDMYTKFDKYAETTVGFDKQKQLQVQKQKLKNTKQNLINNIHRAAAQNDFQQAHILQQELKQLER